MSENPLQQLLKFGQSVWYDNISRDLLQSGELARLVKDFGVRGLTSNPTIFDAAIKSSSIYDEKISRLKSERLSADEIFENIAVGDIGEAADLLLPVYESSGGNDGFVSIEVSPLLAADTAGSIKEGTRLFDRLARPNIMIKIPGTPEGLPAIKHLLEAGINVNITLLFSVENYEAVARTYCEAIKARVAKGLPVDRVRSVASFFVSRVDTLIDQQLEEIAEANENGDPQKAERALSLRGKFGVANSKIAYQRFKQIFGGGDFAALKQKGAAVQRPLWASTSTKNPAYRDVFYCEDLIGPDTVNTMPHATLLAFADHGRVSHTVETGLEEAVALEGQLASLGIDVAGSLRQLQVEGVKKFADSFRALNETIQNKN